tara:strand:+ start:460 stop:678 length:219 start_codon:yes stop_codon:yes gene_type:complete
MANNPNPDRDVSYMREVWGTTSLTSDYWSLPTKEKKERMLREINNDDMTPKRSDHNAETELFLRENTNNESK